MALFLWVLPQRNQNGTRRGGQQPRHLTVVGEKLIKSLISACLLASWNWPMTLFMESPNRPGLRRKTLSLSLMPVRLSHRFLSVATMAAIEQLMVHGTLSSPMWMLIYGVWWGTLAFSVMMSSQGTDSPQLSLERMSPERRWASTRALRWTMPRSAHTRILEGTNCCFSIRHSKQKSCGLISRHDLFLFFFSSLTIAHAANTECWTQHTNNAVSEGKETWGLSSFHIYLQPLVCTYSMMSSTKVT